MKKPRKNWEPGICLQVARQIEFLVGRSSLGLFTTSLEDPMGIAQHHDAVSGTAKQHTTDDYSKRLALGASKVHVFPFQNARVTIFFHFPYEIMMC
jgi:hypothetical protein